MPLDSWTPSLQPLSPLGLLSKEVSHTSRYTWQVQTHSKPGVSNLALDSRRGPMYKCE